MDRGIRIAIMVACVLSIGLGLIWDSVIDASRSVIMAESKSPASMDPDPAVLRVNGGAQLSGDEGTSQKALSSSNSASASAAPSDKQKYEGAIIEVDGGGTSAGSISTRKDEDTSANRTVSTSGIWSKCPKEVWERIDGRYYTPNSDDNGFWVICNRRFRFLRDHFNVSTDDWVNANPGMKYIREGKKIRIPDKIKMPG